MQESSFRHVINIQMKSLLITCSFAIHSIKLTVRESGWVAGEGGSVVVAAIRAGTRRNDDEAEGNEGAEQVAVVLLGCGGGLPVRVHDQRKRRGRGCTAPLVRVSSLPRLLFFLFMLLLVE